MMPHEAANVVRVGPYLLVAEECGRMPEVQRLAKPESWAILPWPFRHVRVAHLCAPAGE